MGKIINTFINSDYGIQSFVVTGKTGKFNVSLKDTDADDFVGIVKIFNNEADANKYAKSIVA